MTFDPKERASRALLKIKRCLINFTKRLSRFAQMYDKCEICKEEDADYICVGCDRHICGACDSGYYADVEFCKQCRSKITPEEEEADRKECAESLAEECTCGTGGRPCELGDEKHEFLKKYAPVEKK
jgi:hypothetical protein